MAERTALGEALDGWRRRQRVEWTHVARASGVSRNTIYNALDGGTPNSDTLRKIAKGLATDPHTGEVDRLAQDEILTDLFREAGYEPPAEAGSLINFDDELLRRLEKRATASEFRELLDRWSTLSPARRRLLEAAIRAALED